MVMWAGVASQAPPGQFAGEAAPGCWGAALDVAEVEASGVLGAVVLGAAVWDGVEPFAAGAGLEGLFLGAAELPACAEAVAATSAKENSTATTPSLFDIMASL